MPLIEYFRSAYLISIHTNDARLFLDLLITNNIPFHKQKIENDRFSCLLYSPHYREYVRLRGKRRYRNETRVRQGFLKLLENYRKRIGLAVGFFIAAVLLVLSSLFVWDITIDGTDRISEQTILNALESRGIHLGAFIPSVDTELSEEFLILDVDGLSFVSINLKGTVVQVEVHERKKNTEIVDLPTLKPGAMVNCVLSEVTSNVFAERITAVKSNTLS